MYRFLRLLAVPVLALGLTAFEDAANKFKIDMPADWTDEGNTDAGFHNFRAPDGLTGCAVKAAPVPALAAVTQEQINAEFGAPLDAAGWANLLGADVSLITVSEGEARPIDGYYLQIATLNLKAGFENVPFDTQARTGVIIVPGRILIATCMTKPETYAGFKDTFETTVSSLRPL